MKKGYLSLLLNLLSLLCLAQNTLVMKNVSVIDMKDSNIKRNQIVIIQGNKIRSISSNAKIPPSAKVVDGKNKFLIPGLWDMHAHSLTDSRYPWIFPLLIANGITGVREMGSNMSLDIINLIRQEILQGNILGPRFGAATGRIIDGPGTRVYEAIGIGTAEEARKLVIEYKRQGMDFIKAYDFLPREVYLAIDDEAKRQKISVAGHVPLSMKVTEVSDLGQISIEHNTGIFLACSVNEDSLRVEQQELSKTSFGASLRQQIERKAMATFDEQKAKSLFARLVRNGTWMCPTMILSPATNAQKPESEIQMKYIPPTMQQAWRNVISRLDSNTAARKIGFQKKLEIVNLMHRTGVRLLAGTDFNQPYVFPGFSLHEELELFVKTGLSPIEALRTATINPAIFLNKEKELGSIEKGKIADLVLLDANPLENISNTKKIYAVIVKGKLLERKDLDQLLNNAKELANK
jgi:hypothetical protein